MSERKFKVGDRVKCVKDNWGKGLVGKRGIIRRVGSGMHSVEFFNWKDGHNCDEHGLNLGGRGWNCETDMLVLDNNESVVIYSDGEEVFAKNTITGEIAKATCHKDDTFDFAIGAKLALERLMSTKSEPTYVKQDEYEIGDIVKIRDWDNMAAEFGTEKSPISNTLVIKSDISFVEGQKDYCGHEFKIDDKITSRNGRIVYSLDGCFIFIFTKDHFVGKRVDKVEPIKPEEPKEPKYKPGDIVKLTKDYLGVPKGTRGEIVGKHSFENYHAVDFKFKFTHTHNCKGMLPDYTGLWLLESYFEKV